MTPQTSRIAHSLVVICVLGFAVAAIADQVVEKAEVPDFARGARLYSENCGRCHNARGPSEFSDAHWPMIVTHMRVIAGLPGEQARSIEAFLRASNNPPRPIGSNSGGPTSLSGDELIQAYGCRGCHRIEGEGGSIGPDLSGLFDRRQEDWVRGQIQSPNKRNPKTIMPIYGISDSEVTAIIETLRRGK